MPRNAHSYCSITSLGLYANLMGRLGGRHLVHLKIEWATVAEIKNARLVMALEGVRRIPR